MACRRDAQPSSEPPHLYGALGSGRSGRGTRVAPVKARKIAHLAGIAAEEICERMARVLVLVNEACDDEGEELTPRQKMLVGTAVLRECTGLDSDLRMLFTTADVLDKWGSPEDMTLLSDEVEAWLRSLEGGAA